MSTGKKTQGFLHATTPGDVMASTKARMGKVETPQYNQKGIQTCEGLGKMLQTQLKLVWPFEYPMLKSVLDRPASVLDVGMGQGAWAIKVAEIFEQVNVLGIDLEEANVQAAKKSASQTSAPKRLSFIAADAYKLTSVLGERLFDFISCRSMLYTMKEPGRIVEQILSALKPDGGVAHFFCEDFQNCVLAYPTRMDIDAFWREGPCTAFKNTGGHPNMGRMIYNIVTDTANKLNLEAEVKIKHIPVSTSPCMQSELSEEETRQTFADMFTTWKDYSPFVAKNSEMGEEEFLENIDDIIKTCLDSSGYVLWMCTVCEIKVYEEKCLSPKNPSIPLRRHRSKSHDGTESRAVESWPAPQSLGISRSTSDDSHLCSVRSKRNKNVHTCAADLTEVTRFRKIFDELSDCEGYLSKSKFESAHDNIFKSLELTRVEMQRLFKIKFGREAIDFKYFFDMIRKDKFLKNTIVSNYDVSCAMSENLRSYNYDLPTHENHRHPSYLVDNGVKEYSKDCHGDLYGEFVEVRMTLDYAWQYNYTKERQEWQDMVVRSIALKHKPEPFPWLIFTCGPMGAGKGYALRWMSLNGILPMENIVHIDMDKIKRMMPEWPGHVRQQTSESQKETGYYAGSFCHKESGFIAELCQEVSLESRQNTCIDGSLQDHGWWIQWIKNMRKKYPWYKVAIFYVFCDNDKTIFSRAESRGKKTGRIVPLEILQSAIKKTKESVMKLSPHVDFVVRINNEESIPTLERFEDNSHSFRSVSERFQTHSKWNEDHFPHTLPPFYLFSVQDKFSTDTNNCWAELYKTGRDELFVVQCKTAFPNYENPYSSNVYLAFSAVTDVNFDKHSREVAGVPPTATSFAWCYGAVDKSGNKITLKVSETEIDQDAFVDLLSFGGFVYFSRVDKTSKICVVAANASLNEWKYETFNARETKSFLSVQFRSPQHVPQSLKGKLERRWVTAPKKYGEMTKFAWITPDEDGFESMCPLGGFAFSLDYKKKENFRSSNSPNVLFFPCDFSK